MVNKPLQRKRRNGKLGRGDVFVPVLNRSLVDQHHGIYAIPADGQWHHVPVDLAERLVGDPRYDVGGYLSAGSFTRLDRGPTDHIMVSENASIGDSKEGIQCGGRIDPVALHSRLLSDWPSVVIVIPVHNCPELLSACAESLKSTNYRGQWRTVWVDDGSTDPKTKDLLTDLSDRSVLTFPLPVGFSYAANTALRSADDDLFIFVNQDCYFHDPEWLTRLVTWMQSRPACGIAGAKLIYPNGKLQHIGIEFPVGTAGIHRLRGTDPSLLRDHERVMAVTGAVFAVRRSLWETLQGFDEAYKFGYEDVDFCFRATVSNGAEVWCVSDAVVTHIDNGVRNSSPETARRTSKWNSEGEQLFRARWGRFIDRVATAEVAITLPHNDLASIYCQLGWKIANYFVNCGQKTTVYTYNGGPPMRSDGLVLFDSGRLLDLSQAETLVVLGWQALAITRGVQSNRRFYIGDDHELIDHYLGPHSGILRLHECLPTDESESWYAKRILEAPV